MIRFSLFILFVLLGLLPVSAAVQGKLSGRVIDAETEEPVAGVIVKSGKAFTSTDKDGRFHIAPPDGTDSISFRLMGYQAVTIPISSNLSAVPLSRKATRLNDVIVKAPDIYARGDTLVFNVSQFAKAEDNAIIDVIKRLPGVKVKDDGTIEYQGKPINKFYLDGNDFIGGQYGLATNNISHKDVASVEVMENHQPVKALEGIEFPEEAGINLKLKENARDRWVGVAQGSLGATPLLWDASVFTMRMSPKIQNTFTLRGDNTGWNPATYISDHDFDNMFASGFQQSLWPEYISADAVSTPLSEKRTRDNLSWLADAIAAWKKGDTQMRLKLDFIGDRLEYNSGFNTDYFSTAIPTFAQKNSLRTKKYAFSGHYNAEINKRQYYLKEKLSFEASRNDSRSDITGSFDLNQQTARRTLSINNDLKLVRRNEKKIISVTSRNTLLHRPDRLSVAGEYNSVQSVGTTDFRSTTESRFGRMTRFWKYYVEGGADIDYHRLNLSLSGMGDYNNSGVHNIFQSNIYAIPQVDYERDLWRLSLRTPVSWQHQSVSGHHDYINVSPSLYARRKLSAKSELSATATYRLASPQAYLNIENPVLSDFRNLFIAGNPAGYSHNIAATISYRYRNPLKAIFTNIAATYNYSSSSAMTDNIFIDDFIVTTFRDHLFHTNSAKLSCGISKGLGHSRFVVGCEASSSFSSSSSMRNGAVIPFRQAIVEASPYFKGSIARFLSMNYEAAYSYTRLVFENQDACTHSFRNNLALVLIPRDDIQLTLGTEHYLTRFPEGNTSNLVLFDASAVWRLTDRIRLSVSADNLLDRRCYSYITYGSLSRTEHTFQIRPRTILASMQYRF